MLRPPNDPLSDPTLLPPELLRRFAELGPQRHKADAIVLARFHSPASAWDWYAVDYEPDRKLFHGLVNGVFPELGAFSFEEILTQEVHGDCLERDLQWKERPLVELYRDLLEKQFHRFC